MQITRYKFYYLTLDEMALVQLLDEFKIMEYRTMFILNQGDDDDMDKYLSKFDGLLAFLWNFFRLG